MPRRCSCFPRGEFTNFIASGPKRATNFWQPVCGCAVTSITAEPSARRVPAGKFSSLKSISRKSWSPANCQRSSSCATSAMTREFMILSCISGCADPSAIRELLRIFQLSPTRPSARLSSPAFKTSRSSTRGRRTINFSTPSSCGDLRISSKPASSSAIVRCFTSASFKAATFYIFSVLE
jgi:hypothetical protein